MGPAPTQKIGHKFHATWRYAGIIALNRSVLHTQLQPIGKMYCTKPGTLKSHLTVLLMMRSLAAGSGIRARALYAEAWP